MSYLPRKETARSPSTLGSTPSPWPASFSQELMPGNLHHPSPHLHPSRATEGGSTPSPSTTHSSGVGQRLWHTHVHRTEEPTLKLDTGKDTRAPYLLVSRYSKPKAVLMQRVGDACMGLSFPTMRVLSRRVTLWQLLASST